MRVLISYSTPEWKRSQQKLEEESYKFGVDKIINYSPADLDSEFIKRNADILSHRRGGGYWIWKPYIISKTLHQLEDGDLLMYADSGMYPILPLDPLFDLAEKNSIVLFQVHGHTNVQWTRSSCFDILECGKESYDVEQTCGSPQVYKRDEKSLQFVKEYLHFCQIEDAVLDSPIGIGPEYREHRHDQSVLSLLSGKNKIDIYRDPSQYGNSHKDKYENSSYEQLFHLHRGAI